MCINNTDPWNAITFVWLDENSKMSIKHTNEPRKWVACNTSMTQATKNKFLKIDKRCYCCNLLVGVALNVQFTTNWMWPKNNTHIYTWREQAITDSSRSVISLVACCHIVKVCAHAARAYWSQQNDALNRMWRSCQLKR